MKPITFYTGYAVVILKNQDLFFKWTNCLQYDCYLVLMKSLKE